MDNNKLIVVVGGAGKLGRLIQAEMVEQAMSRGAV